MYYTRFDTRFCEIILAGDENGLAHLHMNTGEGSRQFDIVEDWELRPDFFSEIETQVMEYLDGQRTDFHILLNPQGTDFQKKVWSRLQSIPYGTLATYSDIARALGNVKGARAVGAANSKNPIPLIIPCHRVIGVDGNLTGFAHGLTIKEKLITLEKKTIQQGKDPKG